MDQHTRNCIRALRELRNLRTYYRQSVRPYLPYSINQISTIELSIRHDMEDLAVEVPREYLFDLPE